MTAAKPRRGGTSGSVLARIWRLELALFFAGALMRGRAIEPGRKRKEAHAQSLELQARRLAKKNEALEDFRKSEKKKRYRSEGKEVARREAKKHKALE